MLSEKNATSELDMSAEPANKISTKKKAKRIPVEETTRRGN